MRTTLLTVALLLILDTTAQQPFARYFGDTASLSFRRIVAAGDGNYVVAGVTYSWVPGSYDAFLAKVDPAGELIWQKQYQGMHDQQFRAIAATSDQGLITIGSTNSNGDVQHDVLILKMNNDGETQWGRTIGNLGMNENGVSVQEIAGGGFRIAASGGWTGALLAQLNATGDAVWAHRYAVPFSSPTVPVDVRNTADGGAILLCRRFTALSTHDLVVFKTDAVGSVQWVRAIGGTGNETPQHIEQSPDGGYFISANSNSFFPHTQLLIKLSSAGTLEWCRGFTEGGAGGAFVVMPDGGVCLASNSSSWFVLIRVDAQGELLWATRQRNGPPSNYLQANSICRTDDGFLISGDTRPMVGADLQGLILKTDLLGNSCFSSDQVVDPLLLTPEQNTDFTDGVEQILTVPYMLSEAPTNMLRIDPCAPSWVDALPGLVASVHPNPFTGRLVITTSSPGAMDIALYDALGRAVHVQQGQSAADGEVIIEGQVLQQLARGIYLLRIEQGGGQVFRKLLKE